MDQSAGQNANAAIFAAQGAARPRLVRALVAAGIALVAAWLIALALGVLGGFEALPGLPSSHPKSSSEASSPTRHAPAPARNIVRRTAPAAAPSEPAPAGGGSAGSGSGSSRPKPAASAPTVTQAPSTTAGTTSSTNGQGSVPTTTGKPVGSPGNGPGGSGAPGQLR
jgi:hypothetical protein